VSLAKDWRLSAIQHDNRDAILHGRPQSRSSQIDSNSAIIAERHQRCRSIPPRFCTGASREGCDYCRIRDIIATRNIQHVGAEMTPAQLQTTIQQDAFELSNQIDTIGGNILDRQQRCTTIPTGSCAGEHREECRINETIAAIRENRGVVQLPPVEMLAVIQRDNCERLWRRNHAITTATMQAISLHGENQTTRRGTCEDCLQGGCCVGAAGGGPCTFVGTCNNCIRFRTCDGAANGGPRSREDRTTPTHGPDTSSQESAARSEREEIASLTLTQDAEAEARVAKLVEETTTSNLDQDDEMEHRTYPERTARRNGQRAAMTATASEPVPEGGHAGLTIYPPSRTLQF
jgi:hypothetical protein